MTSIQAIDDEDDETYEDDEYQPLLYSNEKKSFLAVPGQPGGPLASASASSLTQQDIVTNVMPVSQLEEDKAQKKKRWLSIYIMYFTMFMSAVTFSVVLSSIWPYLTEIDTKNANTNFLGWVVAAYSFGQLIASPLFGFIADKRPTREPLIVALLLNVIFNVLYSYAHAFQPGIAGWIMLVSRAFVGFGAGTAAVVRSYVSEATTEKERTSAMAGISSSQALGFILGPALGLAFVPLKSKGLEINAIKFSLNMYTGPGFLSALLGVVNIVLLIFFRDVKLISKVDRNKLTIENPQIQSNLSPKHRMKRVLTASSASDASSLYEPRRDHFDRVAAAFAIILFFIVLFVFSVFETIATPLSMDEFAWKNHIAVLYNNIFFACLAVIAVLTFIVIKFVTKKVDERVVLMVGMFMIAFGYFAMIPMSDEPPDVNMMIVESEIQNHPSNSSSEILLQNATSEVVGCRYPQQQWCLDVPRIYLFQYILALVLLAIGYPTASLLTYSIYSKILGPFPQGIMMGWLTASGSLARALGPMAISALYHFKGPLITFATLEGLVGLTIIALLIFSPKLVPYERRKRLLSCFY